MIYRLNNIPIICEDDFFKKLNFIKQISVNIGFNPSIVTNILKKIMSRHVINYVHPSPKDTKFFKSITYRGKLPKSYYLSKSV